MYDYKNKKKNMARELDILLAKTLSMFKYDGLPDTIPQRELERQLQTKGYAFITKVEGKLYSFTGGLGGIPDPYGNPTQIVIANPSLDYNATLDLKEDGVLIRNDSMENGLSHLLEKYVYMISESEISMIVNSFNARFPTLLSAGDDRTRESAELYLKRVIDGELSVIAENRLFEGVNAQSSGGGGSMFTQLIEYQQYLKATLYNELGLEMNNNMKRERLTQDEVNITDIIYPFVDNMKMSREMGVEAVNKMYDLELEVGFDSIWAKHAPSDALDEEAFYDEIDMYLDMLLGQQQEVPMMEQAPMEEVDILPDITEEELQDILEQLQGLSEEEDYADESDVSTGGSESSPTDADEELQGGEGRRGDSGDGRGTGDDDIEPGDDNARPSDEPDSEREGTDAGDGSGEPTTTEPTDGEPTNIYATDESTTIINVGSNETDSSDDTTGETDGSESDGELRNESDGTDGTVTDEVSGEPSDEGTEQHDATGPVRDTLINGVSTTTETQRATTPTHGDESTQHADTETEQIRTDTDEQLVDEQLTLELEEPLIEIDVNMDEVIEAIESLEEVEEVVNDIVDEVVDEVEDIVEQVEIVAEVLEEEEEDDDES